MRASTVCYLSILASCLYRREEREKKRPTLDTYRRACSFCTKRCVQPRFASRNFDKETWDRANFRYGSEINIYRDARESRKHWLVYERSETVFATGKERRRCVSSPRPDITTGFTIVARCHIHRESDE